MTRPPLSDTESKPLDPKPWVTYDGIRLAYRGSETLTRFFPGPEFEQDPTKYEREA